MTFPHFRCQEARNSYIILGQGYGRRGAQLFAPGVEPLAREERLCTSRKNILLAMVLVAAWLPIPLRICMAIS